MQDIISSSHIAYLNAAAATRQKKEEAAQHHPPSIANALLLRGKRIGHSSTPIPKGEWRGEAL